MRGKEAEGEEKGRYTCQCREGKVGVEEGNACIQRWGGRNNGERNRTIMMRFIESIVFRDPSSQTQSACIHRGAGRRYSIDFQFLDDVCVRVRELSGERGLVSSRTPLCFHRYIRCIVSVDSARVLRGGNFCPVPSLSASFSYTAALIFVLFPSDIN